MDVGSVTLGKLALHRIVIHLQWRIGIRTCESYHMIATVIDFGLEVTYGDVFGPQIVVDEQFASILKIGDDHHRGFSQKETLVPEQIVVPIIIPRTMESERSFSQFSGPRLKFFPRKDICFHLLTLGLTE